MMAPEGKRWTAIPNTFGEVSSISAGTTFCSRFSFLST